MKIALVHDYIKEYGGAERVLEALHEIFPDAPVYTTVFLPEFLGPHQNRFKNWKLKTSFLQFLPFKSKLISPIRIIAPLIFKTFDFSGFDVVIVSATGAYSPNSIKLRVESSELRVNGQRQKTKDQRPIHICYCHTPPRYLYGFATAREWKNNLVFRVLGELANHFLRLVDYKSSQNVDFFIANSKNIKERIKKFYRRDAILIYPPVDVAWQSHLSDDSRQSFPKSSKVSRSLSERLNSSLDSKKSGSAFSSSENGLPRSYFLAGGRIARPKHIDLIIETFVKLKLPLKIFGRGFAGYELELKSKANSKIEFLGEVRDEEKAELMKSANAFIFASEDEDFGITPVEAMSVGTPVIAYRSGGVVESVLDKKTGLFFDELSIESLSRAIKKFNSSKINSDDCIKQAQKFSKERFKKEIKEFVEKVVK